MDTTDKVVVDASALNAVMDILGKLPYREVSAVINALIAGCEAYKDEPLVDAWVAGYSERGIHEVCNNVMFGDAEREEAARNYVRRESD